MAEGNKMDLTTKLPDEILMEVFDRLPSLGDKLRLESVNRRFQHCLVQLLSAKPIPLKIDVTGTKLNQYTVQREQLLFAMQTLATKVEFSSIDVLYLSFAGAQTELNSILSALLVSSDNDCLDKVTKFQILSGSPVSETVLTEVLAKCTKLTDVRLDWCNEDTKNLGLALKEKTLTQLSVALRNHNQQQLIQLYQSVKPNMIKKIELHLFRSMALDMDSLVTELCGGAWAALEELELHWSTVDMRMDKLFSILPQFPALRKCKFELHQYQALHPLLAALKSLFTNQIEITVLYDAIPAGNYFNGCELISVIRQVRDMHPDLQVEFKGDRGDLLRLALGKVSFQRDLEYHRLWHPNCLDCGIFYCTLLSMLKTRANDRVHGTQQGVHLPNARLDRCRIDAIVAHLNFMGNEKWKALHAEMNEAQNLATITFESQSMAMGQFQITVDCGHCLTNGCFGCIVG